MKYSTVREGKKFTLSEVEGKPFMERESNHFFLDPSGLG